MDEPFCRTLPSVSPAFLRLAALIGTIRPWGTPVRVIAGCPYISIEGPVNDLALSEHSPCSVGTQRRMHAGFALANRPAKRGSLLSRLYRQANPKFSARAMELMHHLGSEGQYELRAAGFTFLVDHGQGTVLSQNLIWHRIV